MSNVNTDGLPPEMQARIAQIIEGAKQKVQPECAAASSNPSTSTYRLHLLHSPH